MKPRRVILKLPWPPTLNHRMIPRVFGKFARLVLGPEARKYYKTVGKGVEKLRRDGKLNGTITGPVQCSMRFHYDQNRVYDLSNFVKCVEDALVHAKVIEDDGQIDRGVQDRGEKKAERYVIVTIEEIQPGLYQ